MEQPYIELNDGQRMPQIGLGVWQAKGGEEVDAVRYALTAGYRHIDTAAIYKNEQGVGKALAETTIPRSELYITTKLWNDDIRSGNARAALQQSLEKLGLEYVDLYLLHWPVEGGIAAWRTMEQMQSEGLIRSIGLSNYMPEHIAELVAETDVVPAVNQIEFHPYNQQQDVLDACAKLDVVITAWSPLMQGKFMQESLFSEIARSYNKTAAQVLLRWDIQRGVVTIPKSVHKSRIEENYNVFDFSLTEREMEQINALDRKDGRFGPDPRNFDF